MLFLSTHPDSFIKEMRLAAIKWFEIGQISQAKAAELADVNRQQFINALSRFQVSPILGVLLFAKKNGKIKQIKPLLIQLQNVGLRINTKLIDEALKLAEEKGTSKFADIA